VWAAASRVLQTSVGVPGVHSAPEAVCESLLERAQALRERARAIRSLAAAWSEPVALEPFRFAPDSVTRPSAQSLEQIPAREPLEGGNNRSSSTELAGQPSRAAVTGLPLFGADSRWIGAAPDASRSEPRGGTQLRQWLAHWCGLRRAER
jgi:hypothetical protein